MSSPFDDPRLAAILGDTATPPSPAVETAAPSEGVEHFDPEAEDENDLSAVAIDEHEITNPPGLVGDIARWMTDTAGKPQPRFSLAAALAVCGTVMGRKVRDCSDGRTNIYATILGPSSIGKDYPVKSAKRILMDAGGEHLLLGKMQSMVVIEKRLSESHHTRLAVLGESGLYYGNLGKVKDGASCKADIKPLLMELYSCANGPYIGTEAATRDAYRIDQPHLVMLGDAQPQTYFGCMTRKDLEDGWAARNLTFMSNDGPMGYRMIDPGDVPHDIIERIRAWIMLPTETDTKITANGMKTKPKIVPTTEIALSIFDQFGKAAQHTSRLREQEGELSHYLWSKALEQARRLALIVACGESIDTPTIDAVHARYGCHLVTRIFQDNERGMRRHMAETPWDADRKRIIEIVEKAGRDGIDRSKLLNRARTFLKDARTLDAHLKMLEEDLRSEPIPGKGGGTRYWTSPNWFYRKKVNG